jgi:hypothetical protein
VKIVAFSPECSVKMNSSKAGLISYIVQMDKSLSAKKGKNLERVGAPNNKPQRPVRSCKHPGVLAMHEHHAG